MNPIYLEIFGSNINLFYSWLWYTAWSFPFFLVDSALCYTAGSLTPHCVSQRGVLYFAKTILIICKNNLFCKPGALVSLIHEIKKCRTILWNCPFRPKATHTLHKTYIINWFTSFVILSLFIKEAVFNVLRISWIKYYKTDYQSLF